MCAWPPAHLLGHVLQVLLVQLSLDVLPAVLHCLLSDSVSLQLQLQFLGSKPGLQLLCSDHHPAAAAAAHTHVSLTACLHHLPLSAPPRLLQPKLPCLLHLQGSGKTVGPQKNTTSARDQSWERRKSHLSKFFLPCSFFRSDLRLHPLLDLSFFVSGPGSFELVHNNLLPNLQFCLQLL